MRSKFSTNGVLNFAFR